MTSLGSSVEFSLSRIIPFITLSMIVMTPEGSHIYSNEHLSIRTTPEGSYTIIIKICLNMVLTWRIILDIYLKEISLSFFKKYVAIF
jgi:hypothetical protein